MYHFDLNGWYKFLTWQGGRTGQRGGLNTLVSEVENKAKCKSSLS